MLRFYVLVLTRAKELLEPALDYLKRILASMLFHQVHSAFLNAPKINLLDHTIALSH